jgi:hypothetical protein
MALAAMLVAGCATPRAALGTTRSPCFQALPAAAQAVDHQGSFAGVTRYTLRPGTVTPGRFLPRLPRATPGTTTTTVVRASTSSTVSVPRSVCLVAYKGTFDPRRVPLLQGQETTNHYAVVVVAMKSHRVLAVFLRDRLGKAFTHL